MTKSAPSEATRRMVESMEAARVLPPLTLEHLDALIDWVKTGEAPDPKVVSRGHLIKALMELRLKRSLG